MFYRHLSISVFWFVLYYGEVLCFIYNKKLVFPDFEFHVEAVAKEFVVSLERNKHEGVALPWL